MTGVCNEGKISPGGREMATSCGEREERRPGLLTTLDLIILHGIDLTDIYIYITLYSPGGMGGLCVGS